MATRKNGKIYVIITCPDMGVFEYADYLDADPDECYVSEISEEELKELEELHTAHERYRKLCRKLKGRVQSPF